MALPWAQERSTLAFLWPLITDQAELQDRDRGSPGKLQAHLDTGDEGWLKQTAWGSQEMLSPQESQASPWRVQAGPREDAQAGSSKASARSTRAARSLCGFRWRRLLLSVSPPHASRVALSTCVRAACVACACLCDQATYVSLTYLGGRGSALTVQAMGRAGVPVEEPSSDTPA